MVTGGAGFIGRHLTEELLRRGADEVLVLDSSLAGACDIPAASSTRCKLVRFRLGRDCLRALRPHLHGIDYVFHLAAEKHTKAQRDPAAALDSNIDLVKQNAVTGGRSPKRRLDAVGGDENGLHAESSGGKGITVSVRVPCMDGLLIETVTPGMIAPLVSVIFPLMAPVVVATARSGASRRSSLRTSRGFGPTVRVRRRPVR